MVHLLRILLSKENGPSVKAAVLVAALGTLLVFFFASAFADGEVRRSEMPLRALLGSRAYDALVAGEDSPQHYLGRPPAPSWAARLAGRSARAGEDRRVPDFDLPARDGSTWRMSERRGKVVILNFWTVTCQPCVEEMPTLIELSRILRGRDDVELVTISTDRDWDTVRTVVPDDAPLTVLLDPDRAVVRDKFGTRLYPETWVIDPEGIIRLRVDGMRDWSSPIVLDVIESYL
jgi:peroxiredoxin